MLQFQETKCDQERSLEDSKVRRPYNRGTAHVKRKNKSETEIISKSFGKYLSNIPGKHETNDL